MDTSSSSSSSFTYWLLGAGAVAAGTTIFALNQADAEVEAKKAEVVIEAPVVAQPEPVVEPEPVVVAEPEPEPEVELVVEEIPEPEVPVEVVAEPEIDCNGLLSDMNFQFEFDSAEVLSSTRENLSSFRPCLEMNRYQIVGHADSMGSHKYNDKLSMERAKSVKLAIQEMGIDLSLYTLKAAGETAPLASNDTEEGRAQNRRVELAVIEANINAG